MKRTLRSSCGSSIVELIVTMGVAGILMSTVGLNLKVLDNPLQDGTTQVIGFLKKTRARAISTTSAYFVEPLNNTTIITKHGTNCDDANPILDSKVKLTLPEGVTLSNTAWNLCYTSRGISSDSPTIYLNDENSGYKAVEVFLGGGVRIL